MVHHTKIGDWEWPLVDDTLDTAGLCLIKEYIKRMKYTIADQVSFRPIYDLCMGAERMLLASRFLRWWDQDVGWQVD